MPYRNRTSVAPSVPSSSTRWRCAALRTVCAAAAHTVATIQIQGIAPFCLTVDRYAAGYLPGVFGARQYALLAKPSMLPTALLDWMQRLVMAG